MNIAKKLDSLHLQARSNKWMHYFTWFCRISLAAGFIPSGMQKIIGERFTTLAINHPMGNFLEAFYHTGYYYPFVGVVQVTAAILLLIPRTATIGAFIYFPIILNICVLSLAVRFDGSQITSPLMVCAVLYLLCWDYHKFKHIFPFNTNTTSYLPTNKNDFSNRFPFKFAIGVVVVIGLVIFHTTLYAIMPRNTFAECKNQCNGENDLKCINFCNCIHQEGKSLDECLEFYNNINFYQND